MTPLLEVPGDELRVRIYQADAGLVVDGVLGPMTRASLVADSLIPHMTDLMAFRGSLGLIIRCEGFKGRPYVPPGAAAGVTLDYGFDLGQQRGRDLERLYGELWSKAELYRLETAIGNRGAAARAWLKVHAATSWPITRDQAAKILPRAAGPYWGAAVTACPALRTAPPRVQTALLSVTYSAWTGVVRNARECIERGLWLCVADFVRGAPGSMPRREIEARLIESVL